MKTKFNLSRIMKQAHKLYKNRFVLSETFADCLRRVWSMAKAFAGNLKTSFEWGVDYAMPAVAVGTDAAIANYYATARHGQYMGD
jgi:hypothetical protein